MSDIIVTAEAAAAAERLQAGNPEYHGLNLRLYLDGKDCDGFVYGVSFDSPMEGDQSFTSHGVTVLVDADTLGFVRGSTIEWGDDERGQGFVVQNPNHKKFRGKFFKRKSWQEKLQYSGREEV